MSADTWFDEFYPISAQEIARRSNDPMVLTQHSLQKWKGFLPENLKKHDISSTDEIDVEGDASSCSLCVKYTVDIDAEKRCKRCPLFQLRNAKCYVHNQHSLAVYSMETDDVGFPVFPEMTIRALEQTITMLEKQNEAKRKNSAVSVGERNQKNSGAKQKSSENRSVPHIADVYPD